MVIKSTFCISELYNAPRILDFSYHLKEQLRVYLIYDVLFLLLAISNYFTASVTVAARS